MPISLPTDCQSIINCPTGCEKLPDIDFSLCSPVIHAGQVTNIYLAMPGNPLIMYSTANEWGARIALPATDPSRIITLHCIGNKAEAETIELVGAYGKSAYSHKKHRLSFSIAQTSDTNYTMMRSLEILRKALAWYKTGGGKTYGGTGIPVKVVLNHSIPEDSKAVERITGYIEWDHRIHPCRITSVI